MNSIVYDSPIGGLVLESDGTYLTGLNFIENINMESLNNKKDDVLDKTIKELEEYFSGLLQEFTVEFKLEGTVFRKQVWEALRKIPYGKTVSYGDIAKKICNPKAVRAVGGANHHNNISIIVPCHRVVGSDGKLTGYGGGLWRKEHLLALEKQCLAKASLVSI